MHIFLGNCHARMSHQPHSNASAPASPSLVPYVCRKECGTNSTGNFSSVRRRRRGESAPMGRSDAPTLGAARRFRDDQVLVIGVGMVPDGWYRVRIGRIRRWMRETARIDREG
jgi:hypothetical protein